MKYIYTIILISSIFSLNLSGQEVEDASTDASNKIEYKTIFNDSIDIEYKGSFYVGTGLSIESFNVYKNTNFFPFVELGHQLNYDEGMFVTRLQYMYLQQEIRAGVMAHLYVDRNLFDTGILFGIGGGVDWVHRRNVETIDDDHGYCPTIEFSHKNDIAYHGVFLLSTPVTKNLSFTLYPEIQYYGWNQHKFAFKLEAKVTHSF